MARREDKEYVSVAISKESFAKIEELCSSLEVSKSALCSMLIDEGLSSYSNIAPLLTNRNGNDRANVLQLLKSAYNQGKKSGEGLYDSYMGTKQIPNDPEE